MSERVIFHIDINNCYASIEMLHHPRLRGHAVAVGGNVEARHGIILAKNYEAKARGVIVGQAIWEAKKKCPELIVLSPNYQLYYRFGKMLREILAEYSDKIESFGLDECWMDLTNTYKIFGYKTPGELANALRRRITFELGLTVSIGVSYNKVFAKIGSDYRKPDAVTVITNENYKDIIWPLPAENLLGVGRATQVRLYAMNIKTIGEVANTSPQFLKRWFGKWGVVLHMLANGNDTSEVRPLGDEGVIKSVGNSITTPRDLNSTDEVKIVFRNLADNVAQRLRELGFYARTVQISLRDNNLKWFERQTVLNVPTCLSSELSQSAMLLLQKHYNFQTPLRTVGIRATGLEESNLNIQMSIFEDEINRERKEKIEQAIDSIRVRYGHDSIGTAILSVDKELGKLETDNNYIVHPVSFF